MDPVNPTFEATGGARIGWMNATWPLAKLTATSGSLQVKVLVLGDYRFTPEAVVAITRYTRIPVLGWGIRIEHCLPGYPAKFIFWCLGHPDTLLAGIRDAGFIAQAPASNMPARRGMAIRWQAIVAVIAGWNGLFLLDQFQQRGQPPLPGFFSWLAIGLLLAATVATLRFPGFQQYIIKPGRAVGEVRPALRLICLVSSILFGVLTLFMVFQ